MFLISILDFSSSTNGDVTSFCHQHYCWHFNFIPYLNCLEFNFIGNHGDDKNFISNDLIKLRHKLRKWHFQTFRKFLTSKKNSETIKSFWKWLFWNDFVVVENSNFFCFSNSKEIYFRRFFEILWYFFVSEYGTIVNHLNWKQS